MNQRFDFRLNGFGQLHSIDQDAEQVCIQVNYESCSGNSEKNRGTL